MPGSDQVAAVDSQPGRGGFAGRSTPAANPSLRAVVVERFSFCFGWCGLFAALFGLAVRIDSRYTGDLGTR